MGSKILFGISGICTVLLVLFLNGNISIPTNPLPPLGKFLNPFGGAWTSNTDNEKDDQTLQLSGLNDKVEIIYDDRRVAHIFAQNLEDALFAQGYVEAQNRLFQMEFLAKAAAGELSSIFGDRTLEIDMEKRRRGMKYAAENAVRGWEQFESFKPVSRYMDGVNAYVSSLSPEDYPLEFKLFDIAPTEWTTLKTALIFKQMSLTLAGRNDDVENTNLLYHLGKEQFDFLYPEHQTIENPIIPTEKPYGFDTLYGAPQDTTAYFKKPILKQYFEGKKKGIGSNSWAVHGTKTATGKPIFCNDPHLSLGLPSIWFEVHIHTPEFNAYGVSFPGFPGIMIGFNDYIAWGETNVGQDVEDLFVVEWTDENRTTYLLDGKEVEADIRIEEIKIKGGASVFDTIKYTKWGPIYSKSIDGKHDLAMRWIAHDEPDLPEFSVFVNALSSRNYDDYLRATANYISPAQNFGFASVSGDVALRVNGRFAAKYGQDGRFVEHGDKSTNDWTAFIPRSQNPQIINPQRGFIASANQVSADKTYPYYFTGKFERYRNRSVNGKLEKMQDITTENMKMMQQDAYSHKAADFIPVLNTIMDTTELTSSQLAMWNDLVHWDFTYKADKTAPTIFDVFYKKLETNTWDELLTLNKTQDINLPEDWRLLEIIQQYPDHACFDMTATPEKEVATDVINKSFVETVAELEKRTSDGKPNHWGGYKPLNIYHLTRLPALSEMNIEVDGCVDAINATGYSFGPSWRMVVSLEDKVKAYAVYPGGQSGNPASKYYKNMIPAWTKGEYYTLQNQSNINEIKALKSQSLHLMPIK